MKALLVYGIVRIIGILGLNSLEGDPRDLL